MVLLDSCVFRKFPAYHQMILKVESKSCNSFFRVRMKHSMSLHFQRILQWRACIKLRNKHRITFLKPTNSGGFIANAMHVRKNYSIWDEAKKKIYE